MKQVSFDLVKPVRLVPMTGKTKVSVQSTGKFEIVLGAVNKPRLKDIILCQTDCARLYQTPSGSIRKVLVTLPTEDADTERVVEEVKNLMLKED